MTRTTADEARKLLNDASVDDWEVGPLTAVARDDDWG